VTEPGRAESAAALAQCPRLAAGEPFDFVCAGCGDCCRNRRDLVLSGYDLYRIARRLGLPPRLTADAFCKQEFAPQTLLPAVVLRPNARTGNCPFFEADACTIHAARPLACALYPLGQAIDPATAAMEYYVQLPLCGARVSAQEQRTLQNYLDDAAITARAGIDARWAVVCTQLSDKLQQAGGRENPPPAALHAPCILIIPSRMIFTPSSTPTPRRFGRCWIKCCEINHQRLGKRDIDVCKNRK
jgi:Fe-S-cluster containining protein